MGMHHISGLYGPTILFKIISQTEGFSEKIFEQKICLHIFIEISSYLDKI